MRFDVLDQVSVQQVLAGAVAQVSTHSKKKPAAQDLAIGGQADMGFAFFIDGSDLAGTGTDLTLEVIEATDGALTAGVSQLVALTVPLASLVDGFVMFLEIPSHLMDKEYFGVRYTPIGGTITGTINAYYGTEKDVAKYKSFTSTYVVDNN